MLICKSAVKESIIFKMAEITLEINSLKDNQWATKIKTIIKNR